MSDTNGPLAVAYLDYKIPDFLALPRTSQISLIQGGLNHKMSNEVASGVASKVDDAITVEIKSTGGSTEAWSKDAWKSYRTSWKAFNAALVKDWTKAEQDETFASILDGTIGQGRGSSGPRGPKLNEFERECKAIAEGFMEVYLSNPVNFPGGTPIMRKGTDGTYVVISTGKPPVSGGKNPDKLVTLPAGKDPVTGKEIMEDCTFARLIQRRLENPKFRPGIEAEAKKRLEARARAAEKVSAQAASLEDVL